MFRLNRNKQKNNRNSLIEDAFLVFSENLGLFRFVSKQFCLFQFFRYRFETPKQTKIFVFGFTKQIVTQPKQILFRFVSIRTEIFFCLFRGHPCKESIATLHPFGPIEGHKWFSRFPANRFAFISFGNIQFLPPHAFEISRSCRIKPHIKKPLAGLGFQHHHYPVSTKASLYLPHRGQKE
jgi:hypothetical protein